MYFKAKIIDEIDENIFSSFRLDFDSHTGNEIIVFNNHNFEIARDNKSTIAQISFCNQCTLTYDIEDVFIELLSILLSHDQSIILIDSGGIEEILTKQNLEAMLN